MIDVAIGRTKGYIVTLLNTKFITQLITGYGLPHLNMIFKLPLILLLFVTFQTSYSQSADTLQGQELPETSDLGNITYLALGDSYTVGESLPYGDSFPAQLGNRIELDYGLKVKTTVIAQTGWRTDELLSAIKGLKDVKYNIVTVLIGVNNQFQSKPFSDYEVEFLELLEKAIGFARNDPNNVIVLSIPDYYFTPYGETRGSIKISVEIDAYNAYAKSVSTSKGVKFLDITDITRNGLTDPKLVAKDGLHPSGKAYEQFVERLYPLVRSRLKD